MGLPLPRAVCLVAVSVVALAACQESRIFPLPFDTSLSDLDVIDGEDGDAQDADIADVDSEDSDAGDVEPDTDDVLPDADDTDTVDVPDAPTAEGCGGEDLLYLGEPASVGDPCGCGGVLACNGVQALRCVGDRPEDACGGCSLDSRLPGDSCGPCDDGVMACDGAELVCDGAGRGNLCGGCLGLDAAPNDRCVVDGELGVWACESPNTLQCIDPLDLNACGWEGPLLRDGTEAWPGQSCEATCGDGRLVCDALERDLRCEGPPTNACGGCESLDGSIGEGCGCGGTGTWQCAGADEVVCDGGGWNACGGCGLLDLLPGESCADGAVTICVDPDTVECRAPDGWNACGGTVALSLVPGVACGACASGVVECTGLDEVQCSGDRGLDAFNACGGCEPMPLADLEACGACSAGTPVCLSEEEFACESVEDSGVPNECGGCSVLEAAMGDPCGTCARWACAGGVAECRFSSEEEGCDEFPVRCDELECDAQLRACEEAGPATPARCAGCLFGYVEVDGECEPVECSIDNDCEPAVGEWGACTYASTCDEVAERTRETVEFRCDGGFCVETSRTTEREECANRNTDGVSCGVDRVCLDETCGGLPGPLSVDATTDRPGDVVLSWSASAGATGYEVRIDGGTWTPVASGDAAARVMADALAPAPTVTACTLGVDASDGTFEEYVALSCEGSTTALGAARSYAIRGINSFGAGPEATTVGRRAPGAVRHGWQRATDESGPFSTLAALTTANALDHSAPASGAPRWYRAAVSADGAGTVYSTVVRGSRIPSPQDLGGVCELDSGCGEGECFNGRCVPPGYVYVPSGSSDFGSRPGETGRRSDGTCLRLPCSEEDRGVAVITRPYFMARTELTNAEWQSLFGTPSPSTFATCGTDCPVETINWYEAIAVANRASQNEGLPECYTSSGCTSASGVGGGCGDSGRCTGTYSCDTVTFVGPGCEGYRLPTEAEWEHAYRAGTSTSLHNGDLTVPDSSLDPLAGQIAWYLPNASTRTHAVGAKSANAWGLHDMSGNVWEWTWDHYAFRRDPMSADPLGPDSGDDRVHRGGFWESPGADLRAATRGSRDPAERNMDIGVRLVRTAPAPSCEDLACAEANRTCAEASGLADCGGCTPGFNEVDGQCGMPLPAPASVTTANNLFDVNVQWSAVAGATSYEVSVDGGPWISRGTTRSYVHSAAGAATIVPCVVVGTAVTGALRVSCSGAGTTPAPSHEYRVRAMNGSVAGYESDAVTGQRTVGALMYQWSFSDNDGSTFTTVTGATSNVWNDAAYTPGSWTRVYRVRLSASGASLIYSANYVHP